MEDLVHCPIGRRTLLGGSAAAMALKSKPEVGTKRNLQPFPLVIVLDRHGNRPIWEQAILKFAGSFDTSLPLDIHFLTDIPLRDSNRAGYPGHPIPPFVAAWNAAETDTEQSDWYEIDLDCSRVTSKGFFGIESRDRGPAFEYGKSVDPFCRAQGSSYSIWSLNTLGREAVNMVFGRAMLSKGHGMNYSEIPSSAGSRDIRRVAVFSPQSTRLDAALSNNANSGVSFNFRFHADPAAPHVPILGAVKKGFAAIIRVSDDEAAAWHIPNFGCHRYDI